MRKGSDLKYPKLELGCSCLDTLIGGFRGGSITQIFGESASGKTNICLKLAIRTAEKGQNVIYIDTENSFGYERAIQLVSSEKDLERIFVIEPSDFPEQKRKIKDLEDLEIKYSLVIVDSFIMLYRLALGDQADFNIFNRDLAIQLSCLANIARTRCVPVVITNHAVKRNGIMEPLGGTLMKYWCNVLIELQKCNTPNVRRAILRKHNFREEGLQVIFKIVKDGFVKYG
jgi:DNA repair protein RadB